MGNYQIPDGFVFDPATGLYKSESIVMDEAGVTYRHLVSFNDVSGTYFQELIPVAPDPSQTDTYEFPLDQADDDMELVDLRSAPTRINNLGSGSVKKHEFEWSKPQRSRRRKTTKKKALLIAIPAGILALGILFLIIFSSGTKAPEPLSEEDLTTYETEYFTQPVPETTMTGYEFDGGFTEGGIIR